MGFGLMGAVLSIAMLILVLWQSHRHRDNQVMAGYLGSVFVWGASIFLSRLCLLLGINPQYFLFTTVFFMGLTSVFLFAVVCQQAGWLTKLWVRIALGVGILARLVTIPLMLTGHMYADSHLSPEGAVLYKLGPFESTHTAITNILCLLSLIIIVKQRKTSLSAFFWGTLMVTLGFASSFTPWRHYSLSSMLAAVSTLFFTAAILKKHLFNPLHEANNDLRVAKELAEEANKEKSRFLTRMSHELRTPLNAIIGYTELLMEEMQEAQRSTQLQTLSDLSKVGMAARHLLALINDILDLSRIEAQRLEIRAEAIPLSSFFASIEATIAPLAAKGNNSFRVDVQCSIDSVLSDPVRLRQILINLLGNAAKFTVDGTITLAVSTEEQYLSKHTHRAMLLFRVIDTGIGIPKERLSHIFEAFYQIQDETGRSNSGTGLGLTISRQLARLLGGELEVESQVGKGSVFTLRLPLLSPDRLAKSAA